MESLNPQEPKPFSFPNGTLRKQQQRHPPPPPPPPPAETDTDVEYKECLKNHAAALGGHAVDGCGEFMPSPSSDPAVPTSLTCAACGCHRNFHRRLLLHHHHHHHHHHRKPSAAAPNGSGDAVLGDGHDDDDDDDESGEEDEGGDRYHQDAPRRRRSRSPPPYSSAPHMLLALSGGGGGASVGEAARAAPAAAAAAAQPLGHASAEQHRRRARTKFSTEQKARMHELSEKLGWRMPKRDDGSVEEFCRRIGVEKGVFKVWMHNNKQNLAGSSASGLPRRMADVGHVGGGLSAEDMNGVGVGGESKFVPKDSPSS